MTKLEFGYRCKDIITGVEGIIITRGVFITGCDRIEMSIKDGETKWFDIPTIKVLDEGVSKELDETGECNKYEDIHEALHGFGVLVRDTITGHEGKIVAISIAVSGDISYALSRKYDDKRDNNNATWFDEGRLEFVSGSEEKITTKSKRVGGAVPTLECM